MPKYAIETHNRKIATIAALQKARLPWWASWREIGDYFIPKRYVWLMSDMERKRYLTKNPNILDSTGTTAGRTLASGMMNGNTSPARPWFKFRLADFGDDVEPAARRWLDEVERRMQLILAESNFYNAIAIMYLDLAFFGTAAMLIYEDRESVVRFYNCALGEFYLGQSSRQVVNTFAREFKYTVAQVVEEFGLENCCDKTKTAYKAGGARLQEEISIVHLIEPNLEGEDQMMKKFAYREFYWEIGGEKGYFLRQSGYNELPGVFPRWEVTGNDAYGTGPGHDALPDVIQLQHETKRKGQSLDYMVRPPMVLDVELSRRPTAMMPGGQTFVRNAQSAGAKPAYTVTPPLQELTLDIRDVQTRIREIFHNDLFRMISQLETVRSATEIDARREEKLVLLGPVLDRFKTEALDPALTRTFNAANRAGLLPLPPEEIQEAKIEIQYVSILAAAQSAVGVAPTERFLGLIGNVAAIYQNAVNIPNWDQLLIDYGRDIGVKSKNIRSMKEIEALNAQAAQKEAAASMVEAAPPTAQAAKLLSETEVGGGATALQQMLGG